MTTPWHDKVPRFEADTTRLFEVVVHFLQKYFAHDRPGAERLVTDFIREADWAEDLCHHEGAYRLAAIAHYRHHLKCDSSSWFEWLRQSGHTRTPPEAVEYVREHYYDYLLGRRD